MEVVDALSSVSLFEGLSAKGLRLIANIAKEESFNAGDVIFQEGAPGDKLYFITKGKVRISKQVAGMGEEALAVLSAGDTFGEMALIDNFPRSADAIAHSHCELVAISKDEIEDLLFLHKDLAYEILWNFVTLLSSRLRETNAKMTFLSISGKF